MEPVEKLPAVEVEEPWSFEGLHHAGGRALGIMQKVSEARGVPAGQLGITVNHLSKLEGERYPINARLESLIRLKLEAGQLQPATTPRLKIRRKKK